VVRAEVLRHRLGVLLDALADLRRYRDRVTLELLQADRDTQHMVLHAMYQAAQAAIDVALHALADAELPAGQSYREAFAALRSAGLLDPDLATRLEGWAGLRNVLAHQYASVDFALIHAALHDDLRDLEELGALVSGWLNEGKA